MRGISFKLQEEERERKDQYVPEVSALDFTQNSESGQLDVDGETKDLLKSLGVRYSSEVLIQRRKINADSSYSLTRFLSTLLRLANSRLSRGQGDLKARVDHQGLELCHSGLLCGL